MLSVRFGESSSHFLLRFFSHSFQYVLAFQFGGQIEKKGGKFFLTFVLILPRFQPCPIYLRHLILGVCGGYGLFGLSSSNQNSIQGMVSALIKQTKSSCSAFSRHAGLVGLETLQIGPTGGWSWTGMGMVLSSAGTGAKDKACFLFSGQFVIITRRKLAKGTGFNPVPGGKFSDRPRMRRSGTMFSESSRTRQSKMVREPFAPMSGKRHSLFSISSSKKWRRFLNAHD